MKSNLRLLVGLLLLAGLWTGCSDTNFGPRAEANIGEEVVGVSDELMPEELALVKSGEAEAEADALSASNPDVLENP